MLERDRQRLHRIALAVATVIALASWLWGCATVPPRPPVTPQPAPQATLAIVALDDATGQPVAGARLDVQYQPGEDDGRTNADGYVSLLAPVGPSFVLEVHAEGYQPWDAVVALVGNHQVEARLVPERSAPGSPPWPGRLAIGPGARCFVDGAGACQLPALLHFGEAFSAYVRDSTRVEHQLRVAKAAGYDGVRMWDTLGFYEVWRGREVMPWGFRTRDGRLVDASPGYYDRLREFLALLRRIGLTAHHSRGDLNGQPTSRVVSHAEQVAQLYDDIGWEVAALAEAVNESWQNGGYGPDELRRIVAPAAARRAITALSCPPDSSEEPADIRAYAADVFYVHGHRTGSSTDRLRHIFSLAREAATGTPRLGWQGEPTGPGPGVTVGRVDDPEELALLAAQSFISRQAWVYMSSHGVFFDGPIESQPGFYAVPRIRDAIEDFAPDVMAWQLTHRSASDAVLASNHPREAEARIDQAIAPDGRVVATVYDETGRQEVRNVSDHAVSCDVFGVGDDEQLVLSQTASLGPGASVALTYRVGRLLLCSPSVP